jgi:hypothetical protein
MLQNAMFDPTAVVTAWGSRETACHRLRIYPVETQTDAQKLAARVVKRKLRRGYRLVAAKRKKRG